jgi:membrane-associated phospholipid phosphatase
MSSVRNWAIGFCLTTAAGVLSYFWLDRPIALFVHEQLRGFDVFEMLTYVSAITTPLVVIVFAAAALRVLIGRALSRLQTVIALSVASLAISEAIKVQLKFAFGRTWPETWVRDNPSFIRDGIYGFNPFHGGPGFAAFPSGHMSAICAVMSVLWICYPKFRLLYALVMAVVGIGLIGADFHFLSDVIAGAFLGIWTGWLTVALWELGKHEVRP